MHKVFEFILFAILNILLIPFFILFLMLLLSMKFYEYPDTDICFYIYCLIIFLFRIFVLPFLYLNGHIFYNIKNVLNKIKDNKKLLHITIIFTLICDLVSVFLTTDKSILYSFIKYFFALKQTYIFSGGGLLISYLSFIIWVKYIMPKYKVNSKIFNIFFGLLFVLVLISVVFVFYNIIY